MVQDLAAPVNAPWAAYEWLQAASDPSGTLDRRESVPTCSVSFAAEVELHPELFPSETPDSGFDHSRRLVIRARGATNRRSRSLLAYQEVTFHNTLNSTVQVTVSVVCAS
jgi:hypothetical protein